MAGDFLKELPSFNKENFSKFKAEEYLKSLNSKPVTYIQSKDCEDSEPQVITTDKTNILLRYLRRQLEVKGSQSKRRMVTTLDSPSPKVLRLDPSTAGND